MPAARRLLAITLYVLCACSAFARPTAIFYYVPAEDAWKSLTEHARQIDVIAPQVFLLDEAGIVRGAVEERVLELARQHHIGVMPLLANEKPESAHAVLKDASSRRSVIEDLLARCLDIGCIGIQIDIEGVLQEDSRAYTEFVREAAHAFHKRHLQVSVAVPTALLQPAAGEVYAETFGGYAVMTEPYDLKEIGRHVDFITLMTYGQYGAGMPPGPVASYYWVEQSIRYALRFVPHRKLSMGLGFWAQRWCDRQVTTGSFAEIAAPALDSGTVSRWHAWNRSPWFESDHGGCRSVVWYENERSLHEKVSLVSKYRLHGYSAWRLGQEDPTFWRSASSGR
jgi:spore germination protein YaaH